MFADVDTTTQKQRDLEEAIGVLPADIIRLCYRDDELKGAGDMSSIRAKAERTLPADVLGPLVANGVSAAKISHKYGLPMWVIYELRSKYWPDGVGLADYAEYLKNGKPKKEDKDMAEKVERCDVGPTEAPSGAAAESQVIPGGVSVEGVAKTKRSIHEWIGRRDELEALVAQYQDEIERINTMFRETTCELEV